MRRQGQEVVRPVRNGFRVVRKEGCDILLTIIEVKQRQEVNGFLVARDDAVNGVSGRRPQGELVWRLAIRVKTWHEASEKGWRLLVDVKAIFETPEAILRAGVFLRADRLLYVCLGTPRALLEDI